MERNLKMEALAKPTRDQMDAYVKNPLWNRLCDGIETQYQVKPLMTYSKCPMQPGWNLKYKKAGRALCTLYPGEGEFTALIVIGEREKAEMELILPSFTAAVRDLYLDTKISMGQKWLMIEVKNGEILADIWELIAIRRRS
ncbi:MAG TPA: DUF3788 domain-containing protein [Clostridiales bacterium]|nr:DUF3788 domain-containing protein [Clostridiales bacterium]